MPNLISAHKICDFKAASLKKACTFLFLLFIFCGNVFGQTDPSFKFLDDFPIGSGGIADEGAGIVISIDTDSQGNVYVLTFGNGVYKYDPADKSYDNIITDKLGEDGNLNAPLDLAIDNKDIIHIADSGSKSIKRFTIDGNPLPIIGGNFGSGEDEFFEPTGIEFDNQNNLFIVDAYRENDNSVTEKYFLKIYYAD
ncbi:MAG: hypothetical protein WB492_03560, partial [Christiangramia sp.]